MVYAMKEIHYYTGALREAQSKSLVSQHKYAAAAAAAGAAAKSLQSCPTLCDPIDSSPPGSRPWDSPCKNTG